MANLVQHRPAAFKFDWEKFFLENESIFYKDDLAQRCEQWLTNLNINSLTIVIMSFNSYETVDTWVKISVC